MPNIEQNPFNVSGHGDLLSTAIQRAAMVDFLKRVKDELDQLAEERGVPLPPEYGLRVQLIEEADSDLVHLVINLVSRSQFEALRAKRRAGRDDA